MIRFTPFILCVFLLACCVSCMAEIGLDVPSRELSLASRNLADLVQSLREGCGLPDLQVDTIQSSVLERRFASITQELKQEERDSVVPIDLAHQVYDWDKVSFVCLDKSVHDVFARLGVDANLAAAVGNEKFTHLVVACVEMDGEVGAIVCLVRRLVHFGVCRMKIGYWTGASTTLVGRAPGACQLRFFVYKGTCPVDAYEDTESVTKTVGLGSDGSFDVTLPMSEFGDGDYRIAVYVRMKDGEEFELASWIPFRTGKPEDR